MVEPSETDRLDSETAVYLHLAVHSASSNQLPGCVRFLSLSLDTAARGGLIREAEQCRDLIRLINPRHLLAIDGALQERLLDESVTSLIRSIRKLCPLEQAELLASNTGFDIDASVPDRRIQISQFLESMRQHLGESEA